MASLTIKKLDPRVLDRLTKQARKKGQSLNSYIKGQLSSLVGLEQGVKTFTDLSHLAGTWTAKQEKEFLKAIEPFEKIDEDLWK